MRRLLGAASAALALARTGLAPVLWLSASCSNTGGATGVQPEGPRATAAAVSAPPPAPPSAAPTATAQASAEPNATAAASAAPDAGAAPEPVDPKNETKPLPDGEELQARARGLFDAIAKDDPALGDPFWFPREPFIPLKDIKGAEKYWEQLHGTYAKDIHALHKKRKTWEGATFTRFELGSPPKWVPPGEEANKIGYWRSFKGRLRFEADGKPDELEVRVVITWQGRWYITHLSKFK